MKILFFHYIKYMNIVGFFLITLIIIGIISLRSLVKKHGGPIINTYMKINDVYNTIKLAGIILVIGGLFIFSKKK